MSKAVPIIAVGLVAVVVVGGITVADRLLSFAGVKPSEPEKIVTEKEWLDEARKQHGEIINKIAERKKAVNNAIKDVDRMNRFIELAKERTACRELVNNFNNRPENTDTLDIETCF